MEEQIPMEQPIQQDIPYPMQQSISSAPQAELGALQYQLEGEEIVIDLIRTFKGVEVSYDHKTGQAIEILTSEPLCNDFGISRIRTRLMTFLRGMKVFALSDLSEDYIEDSVISLGHSIIDDIQDNWNEYGIKSPSAASDIVRVITDTAYAVMRKGSGRVYLNFLTKTHNVSESVVHSPNMQMGQQQKGGMLDFLFKKKRR